MFNLAIGILLFLALHAGAWFCTNTQFMDSQISQHSFWIMIALAIPTSLAAYYASRFTYDGLSGEVWAVRFIGFGTSYLVFPALTWWLLKESMFTPKTMVCIFLSMLIIAIQVFWK